MKTRELIRRLQEADPSGEIEVSVGNVDIYYLSVEAAYYDGCLQVLKRDPELEGECFNIIGAEVHGSGQKVVLHPMSIRDIFLDLPNLTVDFVGDYAKRNGPETIERWRDEMRAIHAKHPDPE